MELDRLQHTLATHKAVRTHVGTQSELQQTREQNSVPGPSTAARCGSPSGTFACFQRCCLCLSVFFLFVCGNVLRHELCLVSPAEGKGGKNLPEPAPNDLKLGRNKKSRQWQINYTSKEWHSLGTSPCLLAALRLCLLSLDSLGLPCGWRPHANELQRGKQNTSASLIAFMFLNMLIVMSHWVHLDVWRQYPFKLSLHSDLT